MRLSSMSAIYHITTLHLSPGNGIEEENKMVLKQSYYTSVYCHFNNRWCTEADFVLLSGNIRVLRASVMQPLSGGSYYSFLPFRS